MSSPQPTRVNIRTYQVGFGDCFVLSFFYDDRPRMRTRRILIDFGTTGLAKSGPRSLRIVAESIAQHCEGRLDAIIVTHRHMDHISGFRGRSGEIIASLKPKLVLQPWTEDPRAAVDASRPTRRLKRRQSFTTMLDDMHDVAAASLKELGTQSKRFSKDVRQQLGFLGQDNIKNRAAVEWLMKLPCKHRYLAYGYGSGLERLVPGLNVHVLGPPTVDQTDEILTQRSRDADEFWHFQAMASKRVVRHSIRLFPKASVRRNMPPEARWFIPRLDSIRGEQLLQIVRNLDNAMNNTSLIMLFETGNQKLLFPGDAQLENWSYALKEAPESNRNLKLLGDVTVYKVGHHGSLNATPKTLWGKFQRRNQETTEDRLVTLLSTASGKHGNTDRGTEVPRNKLVIALKKDSEFHSTEDISHGQSYEDIEVEVDHA
ncbi:MAG: hypothetical protein DHS20C01_24630 [marine bacterium B5-7]|nr:MAG: hypothetical protein DHS20C01_24630 [marine bacterium B5-7]